MVEIKRYPMGMTGKKLRKQLGIAERIFATQDFRLPYRLRIMSKAKRLPFLIQKAQSGQRDYLDLEETTRRRKGFDHTKLENFPMSPTCRCWVCDALAAIRHHIVPLSAGGRNKKNNIVPLCNGCHLAVHPHMKGTEC